MLHTLGRLLKSLRNLRLVEVLLACVGIGLTLFSMTHGDVYERHAEDCIEAFAERLEAKAGIRRLQWALNEVSNGRWAIVKPDGIRGVETDRAINAFAEEFGLFPDAAHPKFRAELSRQLYNELERHGRLNELNSYCGVVQSLDK